LLFDRLQDAHQALPNLLLACADGQALPYPETAFDLIVQFTVFSSILDERIKQHLAQEMLRVLAPGGLILWYDFWLNPLNRQTRGIRPQEIRGLFPGCACQFRRITLAPPLARCLAPLSWQLCALLEKLVILNTHYLATIRSPVEF
jgi:SAM-dependent methyltransferase